mmetsp:Transcript_28727/g.68534  ORF Transcript_28727/g.68534 Transcript_28727/m.68534 type:complete len:299 (+) Transcript_28727:411-1307(+)
MRTPGRVDLEEDVGAAPQDHLRKVVLRDSDDPRGDRAFRRALVPVVALFDPPRGLFQSVDRSGVRGDVHPALRLALPLPAPRPFVLTLLDLDGRNHIANGGVALIVQGVVRQPLFLDHLPHLIDVPVGHGVDLDAPVRVVHLDNRHGVACVPLGAPAASDPRLHVVLLQRPPRRLHLGDEIEDAGVGAPHAGPVARLELRSRRRPVRAIHLEDVLEPEEGLAALHELVGLREQMERVDGQVLRALRDSQLPQEVRHHDPRRPEARDLRPAPRLESIVHPFQDGLRLLRLRQRSEFRVH